MVRRREHEQHPWSQISFSRPEWWNWYSKISSSPLDARVVCSQTNPPDLIPSGEGLAKETRLLVSSTQSNSIPFDYIIILIVIAETAKKNLLQITLKPTSMMCQWHQSQRIRVNSMIPQIGIPKPWRREMTSFFRSPWSISSNLNLRGQIHLPKALGWEFDWISRVLLSRPSINLLAVWLVSQSTWRYVLISSPGWIPIREQIFFSL